jgi:hypothetical protein
MRVDFYMTTQNGTYEWCFEMEVPPAIGDTVNLAVYEKHKGTEYDYTLRCKVVSRDWSLKHYGDEDAIYIGVESPGADELFANPIEFMTDCEVPSPIDATRPRKKD